MASRTKLDEHNVAQGEDPLQALCFADPVFHQRYEGWHVLGKGSRATVVRTWSRDLGQAIALKIFENLDLEILHQVQREVRAVQILATPYLAHTFSLFDRDAVAWFEMEFIDGPTLQDELDRLVALGERMPPLRAIEIALAVSRCVWHAHRLAVLHRDIKPANVLLPLSGRPAAKVTDFGIAHFSREPRVSPPGAITGTPSFASPEALAGSVVGSPHDVYGVAATLYCLLAGGPRPHSIAEGTSLGALRRISSLQAITPLTELIPEVDPEIEAVLLRALLPDPLARPRVEDVVCALERGRTRILATVPRGPSESCVTKEE